MTMQYGHTDLDGSTRTRTHEHTYFTSLTFRNKTNDTINDSMYVFINSNTLNKFSQKKVDKRDLFLFSA